MRTIPKTSCNVLKKLLNPHSIIKTASILQLNCFHYTSVFIKVDNDLENNRVYNSTTAAIKNQDIKEKLYGGLAYSNDEPSCANSPKGHQ